MNEGYLFIIISWLAVLLISTHWFDSFFEKGERLVHSRRKAVIILLLVLILQGIYIELAENVFINVGSFLLLGILVLFYYRKYSPEFSLQIISLITFLGIFYAVAYELFFLDPILMVLSPQYLLPTLLTLFIVITIYELPVQLLVLTGGYLVGEALHKLLIFKHVQPIYVGDAFFRDQLVVGLVLVMLTKGFLNFSKEIYEYIKKYLLLWLQRRTNPNERNTLRTR